MCCSVWMHTLVYAQSFKMIFGSCGHHDKPLETLLLAASLQPDVFLFLGDNIYGDTYDSTVLKTKYDKLASKPSFRQLQSTTRILATWDDHDFGANDAGRHYPLKETSKRIFLEFWQEPEGSGRRNHPGIYHAEYVQTAVGVVQVLLLDLRTFRDNLLLHKDKPTPKDRRYFYQLDYAPYEKADSTLLGKQQWTWLEEELRKPAVVRFIASSTQYCAEYNGYEAWANFPHEQARMREVIKRTKAEGVVFLSGDVHYGELSKQLHDGMYPLYDCTSSGLSETWYFATPNRYRIEGPVMDNHIGVVTLLSAGEDVRIQFQLVDASGKERAEYTLYKSELKW